jgi:hypothetical protein
MQPPPLVVYVDIDDTLIRSMGARRMLNPAAIQHVRDLHAQRAVLLELGQRVRAGECG